jgi:multimeric flavodoxin WrbA
LKVLVLSSSSRREGNSSVLAAAAAAGARSAGHEVVTVHLGDYVNGFLDDCRTCRLTSGECSIADRYSELLLDHLTPADALIIATPLYWYGMSGRLKAFFDRLFCYTSGSSPHSGVISKSLAGKRVALLIACEESYRGATLGLEAEFQELTRYLHQELVGVVVGIANSRGEIVRDPANPLDAAADLGRRLFDIRVTDYRQDTPRANRIWQTPDSGVAG